MDLPFTQEQFFAVFTQYNVGVWPAQNVLLLLGIAIAMMLLLSARTAPVALPLLGFLWFWSALVYFAAYFTAMSDAGYVFASLFMMGALLIIHWSAMPVRWAKPSKIERAVAATLFLYALVIYPLIGAAAGHRFPASVSFGLPCPLVIFTFAVLSLLARSSPPQVFVVPVVWALAGTFAAVRLHVPQDFALPLAAAAALLVALPKERAIAERRRHALPAF